MHEGDCEEHQQLNYDTQTILVYYVVCRSALTFDFKVRQTSAGSRDAAARCRQQRRPWVLQANVDHNLQQEKQDGQQWCNSQSALLSHQFQLPETHARLPHVTCMHSWGFERKLPHAVCASSHTCARQLASCLMAACSSSRSLLFCCSNMHWYGWLCCVALPYLQNIRVIQSS
jgi:hypothetical protein